MPVSSRVRWELARRPWIYWSLVAAVAVVAAVSVSSAQHRADTERERWGTTTPVMVATRELGPGDPAVGLERRHHPIALVPDGAVDEVPHDVTVRRTVRVGQTVTADDLTPGTGPIALVPAGHLLVAVTERIDSGVGTGDTVSVVTDGVVLAERSLVVGRGPDGPLLAVPVDRAPAVAAGAAGTSGVSLLRHP